MTKATAGERLFMRAMRIPDEWPFPKRSSCLERALARERAKVAEDVLAMLDKAPTHHSDFDMFCKDVRAKYGRKGKR
jgi:hypothetical protein